MYPSTLFLSLLSTTAALALPHPSASPPWSSGPTSDIDLPASSLAAPAANLTLRYVALGLGTQNYTCKSTPNDTNSAPASNGATAMLFDATAILSRGSDAMKDATERLLPPLALSLWDTYKVTPDQWPAPLKLQTIGHHFFTTALAPTFVLDSATPKAQIQATKAGAAPAPPDACPGVQREGAVDWLQLVDNGSGFSSNTPLANGAVYRVETAGGAAPKTCEAHDGDILVKYSAEYFFYGPSS